MPFLYGMFRWLDLGTLAFGSCNVSLAYLLDGVRRSRYHGRRSRGLRGRLRRRSSLGRFLALLGRASTPWWRRRRLRQWRRIRRQELDDLRLRSQLTVQHQVEHLFDDLWILRQLGGDPQFRHLRQRKP